MTYSKAMLHEMIKTINFLATCNAVVAGKKTHIAGCCGFGFFFIFMIKSNRASILNILGFSSDYGIYIVIGSKFATQFSIVGLVAKYGCYTKQFIYLFLAFQILQSLLKRLFVRLV